MMTVLMVCMQPSIHVQKGTGVVWPIMAWMWRDVSEQYMHMHMYIYTHLLGHQLCGDGKAREYAHKQSHGADGLASGERSLQQRRYNIVSSCQVP